MLILAWLIFGAGQIDRNNLTPANLGQPFRGRPDRSETLDQEIAEPLAKSD